MMKKIASLLIAVVILLGVVSLGAVTVQAASDFTASEQGVALIKKEEGFSSKPYWDHSQYTVGYGTRCPADKLEYYQQNGISEAEATVLLKNALTAYEKAVNKFADRYSITLTQNQFDALLSISYNCGTGWMNGDTLRPAVVNGATGNDFIAAIALWCNAGGQISEGLLRRRLSEANMYINGEYSRTPPENYTYVLYDANGGSVEYRLQAYDSNQPTAPNMVPVYEGFTFLGWYTERVGGKKVTVLDESTKKTRLYARWADGEGNEMGQETWDVNVTVTGNAVNLRKGPGTGYGIVGQANAGDKFLITETATGGSYLWGKFDGGWIALTYTDYNKAVIEQKPVKPDVPEETVPEETVPEETVPEETVPEETVPEETVPEETVPEETVPEETVPEETVPEETLPDVTEPEEEEPEELKPQTGTVKVSDVLCIRQGPGTGYKVVGYLRNGNKITILEKQTAGSMIWGRISSGWVSLSYVVLDEPVQEPGSGSGDNATGGNEDTSTGGNMGSTTTPTTPTTKKGTITGNELRIRSGAGTSYSVLGYLNKGAKVEILETKQVGSVTWGKIASGWISMDYVELEKTGQEDNTQKTVVGTVKVDSLLRVRSGPSTSYAVTAYLYNGNRVEILEQRTVNGTVWGKISKGWISLDYVELDKQNDNAQSGTTPTPPTAAETKTVIADCLCVRSGAGTNNRVVNYLYTGAKVQISETTTVGGRSWGKISSGWICLDYVK